MKILARILALFLIMPMVELILLLAVGEYVGFWPTIGLIVVTGLLGGFLAKREGLSVWRQFNDRLNSGGLPGKELIDGVIILCAGALLITPGVLTDLVGFVGLFPFSRALVRKEIMRRVDKAMKKGSLQMEFGAFGTASMDAPFMDDPAADPGRANGEGGIFDQGWEGLPHQTPRHRDEP